MLYHLVLFNVFALPLRRHDEGITKSATRVIKMVVTVRTIIILITGNIGDINDKDNKNDNFGDCEVRGVYISVANFSRLKQKIVIDDSFREERGDKRCMKLLLKKRSFIYCSNNSNSK